MFIMFIGKLHALESVFHISQARGPIRSAKLQIRRGNRDNLGIILLMFALKHRVATVREKSLESDFFSMSGKSQGILI